MKKIKDEKTFYLQQIENFERKVFDLRQLIEISKGLNSTLEYNVLIESILLTCMGQMQLLKAGMFLKRNIDDKFFALHRNHKGFELNRDREYLIGAESYLVEMLNKTNRCYTYEEIKSIKQIGKAELNMFSYINPSILVPLKGKGRFQGIIVLGDRISVKDFTDEEREYLMDIASLAGIAIENAYLYEVATTDMMTKLKIHHYFQTILAEEIENSRTTRLPLSLLMIDIDNFKQFNDHYGHLCGDLVLKNVSALVKKNCRQIDTAARYGGEEIAIILTNTDLQAATHVAERIRSQIESSEVEHEGELVKVTVSIGVAEIDFSIRETNYTLITRADNALYQSKKNGKNQVTCAAPDGKSGESNATEKEKSHR